MRVITGSARGRRLGELKGMETRPTTDKVKESIFNCIQFDVEDARVLDLFAGTGQLGIEALSRGAKSALFVDKRADAVNDFDGDISILSFRVKPIFLGQSSAAKISRCAIWKKTRRSSAVIRSPRSARRAGGSTSSSSIRRTKADFWSRRWKRSRSLTFYHPMV